MEQAGGTVWISAITLVEVCYLAEKKRIAETAFDDLMTALHDADLALKVIPLDAEIAAAVERIPRDQVPDMPDRIIAATAFARGLPLVTCDAKIRTAPVSTI